MNPFHGMVRFGSGHTRAFGDFHAYTMSSRIHGIT
jgi:hypothetical protein